MIDEKELKSYIERLHKEHHGGKGDWHFRLALRKVLYFIDAMNKRGATSMDVIKTKRMKTIDEFATEYAQDKYMPVQTSQAVKAGANYVLEEIEKAMDLGEPPYLISVEQAYYIVSKLIKQLKGE